MVETIKDDEVGLYADFDNRARRAALAEKRRSTQTLPVIDFTAYTKDGSLDERKRVARALRAACIDTGFFYLANHGIAQAELDVAHAWGHVLFEQPRAEKAKLDKSTHPARQGWMPVGGMNPDANPDKDADQKETFVLPRDFLPIGFTAENPMFVAVNPSLGITTLPQLIGLAKKEPGKISIAVTGIGRLTHLTGELLQTRTDIRLLPVPYTGGPAPALGDVATGRVSMIIEGYSGIAGAVNAGTVKLIAVASPQRLPEFPDLPTVAETVPDFTATGWQVLVAPVGTPDPIIRKVSDDLVKVVTDADFKARLGKIGSYSRPMPPAETLAFVQKEQRMWLPVLERIAAATK